MIRTDLANEALTLYSEDNPTSPDIDGITTQKNDHKGVRVTTVNVQTDSGAKKIGKPIGRYVTIELDKLLRKDEDSFKQTVYTTADILRRMLYIHRDGPILVVGLGNRNITPDAIGPECCDMIIATRHLISTYPDRFGDMTSVVSIAPGVLGMTGMESGELLSGIADKISPQAIIVIDALASRSISRLCKTIQITDTGIIPGSGVGNHRFAINKETLGVPCIAVGIPTVIDAATLASDICGDQEAECDPQYEKLFVTLKDIDTTVKDCAKATAYAINLALQPTIDIDDINFFLE